MADSKTKILVDSNFYIAINNPYDSNYNRALKLSTQIQKENPIPIISSYIFSEVVTVVSQRVGRIFAINTGNSLIESLDLEFVIPNNALEKEAWRIFCNIEKKNFSFADAMSLALIKQMKIKKFLTFDKTDFSSLRKEFGFEFY